jgi:hypothetical protein
MGPITTTLPDAVRQIGHDDGAWSSRSKAGNLVFTGLMFLPGPVALGTTSRALPVRVSPRGVLP